jgi:phage shock protein PspC (stress-responsive transcriptional regulator)
MKKTWNVNLGGVVYPIDEDAYQQLTDYLQDVKKYLNAPSAEEVLNDIEQRMSELFDQWMQGKRQVITVSDVDRVIAILGRPEQYSNSADEGDEADPEAEEAQKSTSAETKPNPATYRRLYRDVDNAFLGGVCAGIAAYLNVSIVLVRLLSFILIWVYGSGFLFYIVAWIIIPAARTTAQRLEMRGEDVTVENIERKVREEADRVKDRVGGYVRSSRFNENVRSAGDGFVTVLRTLVKVFLAILGAILCFAGFSVLFALIVGLLVIWTGNLHFAGLWPTEFQPLQQALMNPSSATWLSLGLILTIGIPFVGLFRLLFSSALHLKPAPRWEFWVGLIFWLIGLGLCVYAGLHFLTFSNGIWIYR